MEMFMALRSVLLIMSILLPLAVNAEVIAAKKIRLDPTHKALIMLSDEKYKCDGEDNGRFATIIVAMDGASNPSQKYKACYTVGENELNIIFWDPVTNDPNGAGTLTMSKTSFDKTPSFKSWDYLRQ